MLQNCAHKTVILACLSWCFTTAILAQGFTPQEENGNVLAVVIGISDYQDAAIDDLRFAHRDALAFADFLFSPEGGGLGPDQVRLLLDEEATLASIQSALAWQLKGASAGARVILYFAGHGDVETGEQNTQGYLLAHDTPKNNYNLLALGIGYLNQHLAALSARGASTVVISDACHAGTLAGNDNDGRIITATQLARRQQNEIKILSCQPYELAKEGTRWGEGRGAFSYYLIEALRGTADTDKNREIDLYELERFLQDRVRGATERSQHPEVVGGRKSIPFFRVDADAAALSQSRNRQRLTKSFLETTLETASRSVQRDYVRFGRALQRGRLLYPEGKSAFAYFERLRTDTSLAPIRYLLEEKMTVALLDSVQQAIRAYLNTDANELMQRERLDEKYRIFPEYLERAAGIFGEQDPRYRSTVAKKHYFRGLVLRLEGERSQRPDSLYQLALREQLAALELEDQAAYLFNELGLLHLRTRNNEAASQAFARAMTIAPTWALPYNNIASLYKSISPKDYYEYIKAQYETAIALKPDFATAYMNYGNFLVANLQQAEAEPYLRKALSLGPDYVDAYYNLGITIYPQKTQEAIGLFREALRRNPAYRDAHLGLGLAQDHLGLQDSAFQHYRTAILAGVSYPHAFGRLRELGTQLGRQQEVMETLESSLHHNAYRVEAFVHLGLLDTLSPHWQRTLSTEHPGLPERADMAKLIGYGFFNQGNPALAERAFQLAITWQEDAPQYYVDLTGFYTVRKEYREALRTMKKCYQKARKQEVLETYCKNFREGGLYAPLRETSDFQKITKKYCGAFSSP
ncbi:caspase family protein [Lewinella sp. W8]|uniref:caspase family protein n=1 Tax=Lewinella sp. W8 TaxID=2528208 RepID=UPI0010681E37|nr:caspase family protein [Lewinella sp. W8]MTB52792.1 tetratricopeptide repeat protein [Lewinella sp. W8]